MKIKTILLIIVQTFFFAALSAQTTQEQADKIVLERMSSETQAYTVYAKANLPEAGFTIASSAGETIELDYACWGYYIRYNDDAPGRYLIVNEGNGNLLEVDAKSNAEPEDLEKWITVRVGLPCTCVDARITCVSFTPCRQNNLKSSESSSNVKVEFTAEGVQITYNDFEVTCDFTAVNVTHSFGNGVLRITQQGSPNQADCICYTDVSYTISGISQNEVNVIFINGVQVYCIKGNIIYKNHDVSACGVNDPLQNIEWLREFCESLDDSPFFSSVKIDLYKVIDTDEYVFRIGNLHSKYAPCGGSMDWRNCTGDLIFHVFFCVPPMPGVVEEFLKDKEFVAELFHIVKEYK